MGEINEKHSKLNPEALEIRVQHLSCFTDEKTKAQRGQGSCPMSHSMLGKAVSSNSYQSMSHSLYLQELEFNF